MVQISDLESSDNTDYEDMDYVPGPSDSSSDSSEELRETVGPQKKLT